MASERRGVAVLALVGAVALGAGLWGAGARDLSGDELHRLRGGLGAALRGAYGPIWDADQPFWGHLPLSYGLRELALGLFGPGLRLAWRLHAVAGAVAAALVVAATGRAHGPTAGLVAGLAMALDPVLGFHAQDAGNYAISALCGALVLAGLEGARRDRGRWPLWLGAGLFFGCANDLWFALVVGIAAVDCAPRLARHRGRLVRAWLPTLLLPAPLAVALVLAGGGAGDFVLHADTAQLSPPAAGLAVLQRFFGAHLGGYEAGRIADPWDAGPAVLLGLALLGLGRGAGRRGLALGLLLLAGGAALFGLVSGRQLPVEPRSSLGLLPFFALALGRASARRPGLALVLGMMGLALLEQRLDSPRAQQALARAAAAAGDATRVMPPPWGQPGLAAPPGTVACLDRLPPGPLWVAATEADCRPRDCGGQPLAMAGWGRRHVERWAPPASERNAASFLPTWTACRWERGRSPAATATVSLGQRPLDGIAAGVTVVDGARQPGARRVVVPAEDGAVAVAVAPRAPAGLPPWSLFAPLHRHVQEWPPQPVGADGEVHLVPRSLQAPWLRVVLRLWPLLALGLGLAWRRR